MQNALHLNKTVSSLQAYDNLAASNGAKDKNVTAEAKDLTAKAKYVKPVALRYEVRPAKDIHRQTQKTVQTFFEIT